VPPLAAVQEVGRGSVIATTLEPWNGALETHRQLLVNLLANVGVRVPCALRRASRVTVKRTVPLAFDGKLDDWTNDIDDINLSKYAHAVPIPLTSRDAVSGEITGDLDLSALVYFLYDESHLYMGGIVFSADGMARLRASLGDHVVRVDLARKSIALNDACGSSEEAFGEQEAGEVIDTHLLNLTVNDKRTGKIEIPVGTSGCTFECALAWAALGSDQLPVEIPARLKLTRDDGATLQVPPAVDDEQATLTLQLEQTAAPTFFGKQL
jgi:hypothetical protein